MRFSSVAILVLLVAAFLGACSSSIAAGTSVDLSQRETIPAVGEIEPLPLRIAVAAVLSPEGTVEAYRDLADYLGDKLGRPAEIVQKRTYAEVNALIERGDVDLAFVCTSAYIQGHARDAMDLLVVPEIDGVSVYNSSIIVSSSSEATAMEDLRGATFAFTDPMSLTGRAYATSLVQSLGLSPEEFFAEIVYTYSHDRAIEAVAAGVVDAAGVDDLVLQYLMERDPAIRSELRIIDISTDFGIPPVVVPSETPASIRVAFRELLLGLSDDPRGPAILASLGVDQFVLGSDASYASARELLQQHPTTP